MSLRRQYLAKLGSNFLGIVAGFITLSIVPRELGPGTYGRYEFLANFFQQVKSFLDMGSSAYFFTRLSQQQNDRGLVRFYRRVIATASLAIVVASALIWWSPVGQFLWIGEPLSLIVLAAVLAGLLWWLDTTRKMSDAFRLTVKAEMLFALSRLGAAVMLILFVWQLGLSLTGYFWFLIITTLASILLLEAVCSSRPQGDMPAAPKQGYMVGFWQYSHPLLAYSLVAVIAGLVDRWVLQTYGGAVEQGFFGLAYQVGAICFFFTGAISQLLTREFAVAWERQDLVRMRELFLRVVPALYAVACFFCCFVAANAHDVAFIVGGHAFEGGTAALVIMAIYPMHQTYGQLSGSIYYATGQTRLYRNIGVGGFLVGPLLVFWLVAPSTVGGWALGAQGLAIKMVALQCIVVNAGLWFNARTLSLRFWPLCAHQLWAPALMGLGAFVASWAGHAISDTPFLHLLASGIVYCVLSLLLLVMLPEIAALERGQLRGKLQWPKV